MTPADPLAAAIRTEPVDADLMKRMQPLANSSDVFVTIARADLVRLLGAVVPEGWVAVPIQPTEEMLHAGLFAGAFKRNEIHAYEDAETVYGAMLAAAPTPTPKEQDNGNRS